MTKLERNYIENEIKELRLFYENQIEPELREIKALKNTTELECEQIYDEFAFNYNCVVINAKKRGCSCEAIEMLYNEFKHLL